MADGFVALGVAERLAAALPHPPRVTTCEINFWGNMIADFSSVSKALRASRRCMLLLTGAGGAGLLETARAAHA
jgi:hypothetical protein